MGMWISKTTNTEISDSTFDYRLGINFNGDRAVNTFVRMERNLFRWRFAPFIVYYRNNGFVIQGNQLIMAGTEETNGIASSADIGEAYGTFNSNIRDIYFASNISTREDANPIPESSTVDMTFDGSSGAFFGNILSVSGTTMVLSGITAGTDMY